MTSTSSSIRICTLTIADGTPCATRMAEIVPTFPRAKYYAPEGEWQYARHPSERDAISYLPENYDPLVESGQMTLLKGGEEIVPGISVKTFPGHTAHMQAVIIRGSMANNNKRRARTGKAWTERARTRWHEREGHDFSRAVERP